MFGIRHPGFIEHIGQEFRFAKKISLLAARLGVSKGAGIMSARKSGLHARLSPAQQLFRAPNAK